MLHRSFLALIPLCLLACGGAVTADDALGLGDWSLAYVDAGSYYGSSSSSSSSSSNSDSDSSTIPISDEADADAPLDGPTDAAPTDDDATTPPPPHARGGLE